MSTAAKLPAQYLDCFTEFEGRAAGSQLPWLRRLRREAFARFCEIGLPTTHDEDWRFTNVSAIANTAFRLASQPSAFKGKPIWANLGSQFEHAGCRLVFVDGHLAPELSHWARVPEGVQVSGLARELAANAASIELHLARSASLEGDGFSMLNTAFAEDGAYVHVPRGVVLEEPIHLLFVSTLDESPVMSHPRNLIVADENSQASVVEEYVSVSAEVGTRADGRSGLCNAFTDVVAGDGAVLSHYRIEREQGSTYNISTLRLRQGRSANSSSHSVLLGGALVRNNVHPVLAGEGGECLINGLFLGTGKEHIDNYMLVEHASPHCSSRQFYNGILDGRAHGVFHGRIIVRREAQKTDAKQTNRNLLLSDDAQIDTKPQLEIRADDVKCTHGATIGQIDRDALFYLRSRGVGEAAARNLLLLAFAEECMARMKEGSVRSHIERLVRQHVLRMTGAAAEEFPEDSMAEAMG